MKKLSKREHEVLALLKAGKKNKEISEFLGVNEKTVSTYKMRIGTKLGFKTNPNDYKLVSTAIESKVI